MSILIGASISATTPLSPRHRGEVPITVSPPASGQLRSGDSDLILDQKQIVAKLIASAGGIINTRA